jgi:multicomponent Na+:H+ antiporter subunit F
MGLYDWMIAITIGLLVLAMIAFFIKIFSTRYVWTRLLLLNLISAKVILVLVLYAVYQQSDILLDIALTYGIISFLTMTLFSKFVIAGGKHR